MGIEQKGLKSQRVAYAIKNRIPVSTKEKQKSNCAAQQRVRNARAVGGSRGIEWGTATAAAVAVTGLSVFGGVC